MEGIFRIIQSIPSKKAEPFKQWMAQVAAQRIDQAIDPERSIDQAVADYERFKYIIFLCWNHDIFFTDCMSDEAPNEMWFISGNMDLIEKYYNEGNKEHWHYVLEK